jgi:hypothetical protein
MQLGTQAQVAGEHQPLNLMDICQQNPNINTRLPANGLFVDQLPSSAFEQSLAQEQYRSVVDLYSTDNKPSQYLIPAQTADSQYLQQLRLESIRQLIKKNQSHLQVFNT